MISLSASYRILWLFLFLSCSQFGLAQNVNDSTRKIEIIGAKSLRQFEANNGDIIQTLAGNARVRQGQTYLSGDSIHLNTTTGIMEVFGNIHINDADTIHAYSQYLLYIGPKRKAYLKREVRLTDGHGTLHSQDLDYDLATGIASYSDGGKVVSDKTTLTSQSAVYYAETKDIYFKKNVHLTDPKNDIQSDSLMYNTEFRTIHFIAPTVIKSQSGEIFTSNGMYDLNSGSAEFYDQSVLKDSSRTVTGKKIAFDEKSGILNVEGNGKIVDTANKVIFLGGQLFMNRNDNSFLGTRKPVMIIYSDNDSTYISGDTLYSGVKYDDRVDTLKTIGEDSTLSVQTISSTDTIRFFQAFHNVRIFNDSLQAVCGELNYSTLDSVFRLYQEPVAWNDKTQISGDTMIVFTQNQKPHLIKVFNNSFVINHPDPDIFNQISGKTLDAFFIDGNIDMVEVKGFAQTIYYPQNEDSAYIGMNKTTGNRMYAYFANGEMQKVKFIQDIRGALYPMDQIPKEESRLEGFLWQDERRPKTKLEMFE